MNDSKRLLEQAQDSAPGTPFGLDEIRDRRDRREQRRRLGGAVVGLGLTAAVVAGVVFAMSAGTGERGRGPMGGDGLPGTPRVVTLEPGEYSYQRIRNSHPCGSCGTGTSHVLVESWWALEDSGRVEVLEEQNYAMFDGGNFGPGEFPDEGDVSEFPTEPAELRAFLLDRSAADGASPRPGGSPAPGVPVEEGQLWRAIHDFLGSVQYLNTTPELRAAMLQVLAQAPIVSVEAGSTDPLGRTATVLRFRAYDVNVEVFVDPGTGDFLAMNERFGDRIENEVVVEAAGVTSTDDTVPEGDQQTVPSVT